MKKTANSNMYEEATDFVWRTFDAHLSGRRAGLWCVVSEKPLGDVARGAILSSAAALGFGEDACTFVALAPNDDPAEASAPTSHMDGNDLFKMCIRDRLGVLDHAVHFVVGQRGGAGDGDLLLLAGAEVLSLSLIHI